MIDLIVGYTIFGVFIIFAFINGVQIGQKISKNEKVEIKSPLKVIKEHHEISQAQKEAEKDMIDIETILENIDAYDGTGLGQKNI